MNISTYMMKSFFLKSIDISLILIMLYGIFSCSGRQSSGSSDSTSPFVINELLASNHSGIVSSDGNLYDWIEIKNTSSERASLDGYLLLIDKQEEVDSTGKSVVKQKSWFFPSVEIDAGGHLIVYASKAEQQSHKDELHANFKLPSNGGRIQLLHEEEVVCDLRYSSLEDDECYRRLSDGSYEKSYELTPGYDNSRSGYESYNQYLSRQRKGPLLIWEVHSKGYKTGNSWLEIKNISDKPVDLQDYSLTSSLKAMSRWSFPSATLQPGGLYVVDCRKDGFKIGKNKSVMLTKGGKFVDGICGTTAPYGVSIGRVEGEAGFYYFPSPTKGSENSGSHYRFISPLPSFSPTAGVYSKEDSMVVKLDCHGYRVRYTTDGSIPTPSSALYNDSIKISKTTTIRAYCEGDSSSMRSGVATSTFILGADHTLPVFNVTIPSSDLFDKRSGIYELGPGASSEYPHLGANYWKKIWKKVHLEFFDGDSGFSEDCELGIFGGFSRALSKKSFKFRFNDKVGLPWITYDLFGTGDSERFSKFILRSGSQDMSGVMVRDEFFTSIVKSNSPSLLVQRYRPCALYINGEYFGLYYIREKIDKDFVAKHLLVSNDSISIIFTGKYKEEGEIRGYNELMSYVRSHNMSEKEHYDYVKSRFDLTELIDYKLAEYYSCNTDIGNVRYVYSPDPRGDRKWHVILYDLDISWNKVMPASHYLRATGAETEGSTSLQNKLISELLKNKEFRSLFLDRFSMHMHKTFLPSRASKHFNDLIEKIRPEMKQNCERWPALLSYGKWEKNVEAFRKKFDSRFQYMLDDICKELSVTDEEYKKYFSDLKTE